MRVLVVEDDPSVRAALERALRGAGHVLDTAGQGARGLELAATGTYEAVVLDLGLPDLDGLEICKRLRATGHRVPVLMLTARAAVADRVAGLDAGADDYLVKPFALDELLARLRAFERRGAARPTGVLHFEDLVLDRDAMECRRGDREIPLTRTEFELLGMFMANPRRVLTRDAILDAVWGYDFGPDSNVLDVYIGYLRAKTEAEGESRLIQTVRGVGYALRESSS